MIRDGIARGRQRRRARRGMLKEELSMVDLDIGLSKNIRWVKCLSQRKD